MELVDSKYLWWFWIHERFPNTSDCQSYNIIIFLKVFCQPCDSVCHSVPGCANVPVSSLVGVHCSKHQVTLAQHLPWEQCTLDTLILCELSCAINGACDLSSHHVLHNSVTINLVCHSVTCSHVNLVSCDAWVLCATNCETWSGIRFFQCVQRGFYIKLVGVMAKQAGNKSCLWICLAKARVPYCSSHYLLFLYLFCSYSHLPTNHCPLRLPCHFLCPHTVIHESEM